MCLGHRAGQKGVVKITAQVDGRNRMARESHEVGEAMSLCHDVSRDRRRSIPERLFLRGAASFVSRSVGGRKPSCTYTDNQGDDGVM
jgi:hypothetical protein